MTQFIQQLVNGLFAGSAYAVVALGFGLVFSVMRVLNMAHPDFAMVGAYVAYLITTRGLGSSTIAGLTTGLAVALFIGTLLAGGVAAAAGGLVLERLVIRPIRGRYVLIPFIATAGVSIFLENGANALFGANPVFVASILPTDSVRIGGVSFTTIQLTLLLTSLTILVGVSYYVRRTRWGLATRAVAERPEVAAAFGVNISGVSRLTIGLASALAGAAGVTLAVLQTSATPFMGLTLGLKSFVCMLVAGNRHIEGIFAAGIALGVLESLVTGYLTSQWRDAVAFTLLLCVLMFRPSGLFGSYGT